MSCTQRRAPLARPLCLNQTKTRAVSNHETARGAGKVGSDHQSVRARYASQEVNTARIRALDVEAEDAAHVRVRTLDWMVKHIAGDHCRASARFDDDAHVSGRVPARAATPPARRNTAHLKTWDSIAR